MKNSPSLLCVILLAIINSCALTPTAGKSQFFHLQTAKSLSSWKSLNEHNIIKQQYDFSCGTAALATLMRYHFGESVDEFSLLKGILKHRQNTLGNPQLEKGLSLLELKQAAERWGYEALGLRIDWLTLCDIEEPVIAHFRSGQTGHFVVFKGCRGNRVFFADPREGNLRMPIFAFLRNWTGIILLLQPNNSRSIPSELQTPSHWQPLRPELRSLHHFAD